ncbi:MAG: HNH endonuclease signature motif containing protein [Nitrosomonas ureae]
MAKKTVVYDGVVYTRYDGRFYYNPNGTYLAKKIKTSLHRQIWLDAGRTIPEGWHIHHIDGDVDNNTLENFDCIPCSEHLRKHIKEKQVEMQQKLDLWRRSDEGQQTLRDNARKMHKNTPRRSCTCKNCGNTFETRHPTKNTCSSSCKKAMGIKQIEKTCEICSKTFWARKASYRETQTCSYSCGWALRKKKAGV